MAEKEFCKKQIRRLTGLDFFPRSDTPAIAELVAALQWAPSDGEAESLVTWWIKNCRKAPAPADIMRHFQNNRSTLEKSSSESASFEDFKRERPSANFWDQADFEAYMQWAGIWEE